MSALETQIIDMNCRYLGISTLQLMENAGKEVARECSRFERVAVFCGCGNNGGDGLVAARHLSGMGKKVQVYLFKGNLTTAAEKNLMVIEKCDLPIETINDSSDAKRIAQDMKNFDCAIDAITGVGMKGELREPAKSVVDAVNSADVFRVAVDVPTGHFSADAVISFHTPKVSGAKVVDIGIPREAETFCGPGDVFAAIMKRTGCEHKGDFGRLLVVGGCQEYSGTPLLVANAALAAGVDLVVVKCPSYAAQKISDPNIIVNPLESEFYLSSGDVESIVNSDFDALVIGNGLGVKPETKKAVNEIVKRVKKPVVVDADAIKILDGKNIKQHLILTPHSREFTALFKEDASLESVKKYAEKTGATILLKGQADIIAQGTSVRFNKTGNPFMTVGGTGDVLAGITGALAAQGAENFRSACAAAFLCGSAGDIAACKLGFSMKATDVIEAISAAAEYSKSFI